MMLTAAAIIIAAVSSVTVGARPDWIGSCSKWGDGSRYYGADCNAGTELYASEAFCARTAWPGGGHYDFGTWVYPPNSSPGSCNAYEIATNVKWVH